MRTLHKTKVFKLHTYDESENLISVRYTKTKYFKRNKLLSKKLLWSI